MSGAEKKYFDEDVGGVSSTAAIVACVKDSILRRDALSCAILSSHMAHAPSNTADLMIDIIEETLTERVMRNFSRCNEVALLAALYYLAIRKRPREIPPPLKLELFYLLERYCDSFTTATDTALGPAAVLSLVSTVDPDDALSVRCQRAISSNMASYLGGSDLGTICMAAFSAASSLQPAELSQAVDRIRRENLTRNLAKEERAYSLLAGHFCRNIFPKPCSEIVSVAGPWLLDNLAAKSSLEAKRHYLSRVRASEESVTLLPTWLSRQALAVIALHQTRFVNLFECAEAAAGIVCCDA